MLAFTAMKRSWISGPLLPALAIGALLPIAADARQRKSKQHGSTEGLALYIANVGDGSVMRCDGATGKALSVIGKNANPCGMTVGPDHNLYTTSPSDGTVNRYSLLTGKSLGTFIPKGRGGMGYPITLAFGPDGNLYVANWQNNDVRRYNGKTGAFIGVFARYHSGGLVNPGDIAFGPDGDLYVTNNSANDVLRFDGKTGASKGTFVKPGSGGLKDPQNIAFGPGGDLFVGGPAGVLRYRAGTGKFKSVFAAPGPKLSNVGGLAFGPAGDLFVGDWKKNDVVRYDGKSGAFKGVFVQESSGLLENRYILFGPAGGGGEPASQLAERMKRQKADDAALAAASSHEPALLEAGKTAPDFTAIDPNGKRVRLSDFKGHIVILDFWATWCGPCQSSMPHLQKVFKQVKDKDVVVLAVCVMDKKDAYDKWVRANKDVYTFPTAFDPAGRSPKSISFELYHVGGIPTQFIIGKDGTVAAANVGYDTNDDRLEKSLASLGVSTDAIDVSSAK